MKNITRMDYGFTIGWWVRVSRCGKKMQKYFPDGKYNSRYEAYNEACTWRESTIKKLEKRKPSLSTLLKRPTGMQDRSIARVRLYTYKGKSKYIVGWGSADNRFSKMFDIDEYGREMAKQKAYAYAKAHNRKLGYRA